MRSPPKPKTPKSKSSFRTELEQAEMSQRDLARFLGKDPVTVNRWCSARGDGLQVPMYARAFVRTYARLKRRDRIDIAEGLGITLGHSTAA